MASPQVENGFTRIANEIMEALARTRIPGEAYQILTFIIRKTYGFNKKEDNISLSQFYIATGIKKPSIIRALYKLRDMNLIIKKDNEFAVSYSFNKDFETWKPLSKKITNFTKEKTLKQICYICNFTETLEEHHINPRAAGGSNRVENKITLCPNCHALTHKGKYTQSQLIIKKDNIEKTIIKKDNENRENGEKPLSKKLHTKDSIKRKEERHINIEGVTQKDNTPSYEDSFLIFYKAYPNKVAKPHAYKAWQKIAPTNGTIEAIMAGLEKWKVSPNWTKDSGQYIPHPATWLNQRRWEDEIPTAPKKWNEE